MLSKYGKIVLEYKGYSLINVFQNTTPDLRQKIVDFWEINAALPDNTDPYERAYQVAIIVMNNQEDIIGVTTAFEDIFPPFPIDGLEQKKYFYYRFFIQPKDRLPEMFVFMTAHTYDLLKEKQSAMSGIAFITANKKLMRRGLIRKLAKNNYIYAGKTKTGLNLYYKDF